MKPARPRGRPRQFDPDLALAAMREVFWRHGFEATSLEMLCEAASINRPSLYAAFGDKRAIYRTVLLGFIRETESELARSLDGPLPLREALASFYGHAVAVYRNENGGRGCFAICTLAPLAAEDSELREVLSEVIANMDAALERRICRAVREGELSVDAPASVLSCACSAILQSLSIRARAGADTSELKRFAASAGQVLLPWIRH